jgi:hypothetical protein
LGRQLRQNGKKAPERAPFSYGFNLRLEPDSAARAKLVPRQLTLIFPDKLDTARDKLDFWRARLICRKTSLFCAS